MSDDDESEYTFEKAINDVTSDIEKHNEKVKLTANYLNIAAAGLLVSSVFLTLLELVISSKADADASHFLYASVGLLISIILHKLAQIQLRDLR